MRNRNESWWYRGLGDVRRRHAAGYTGRRAHFVAGGGRSFVFAWGRTCGVRGGGSARDDACGAISGHDLLYQGAGGGATEREGLECGIGTSCLPGRVPGHGGHVAREWRWGGRTKPTRRSHHHDRDNNNSKHDNDHDDDNFEFTLYHTHAHVHPFSLADCFPFLRRSPPLESLSSCRTPTGDSGAHRGGDHHAALRLGPYPRTPAQ